MSQNENLLLVTIDLSFHQAVSIRLD